VLHSDPVQKSRYVVGAEYLIHPQNGLCVAPFVLPFQPLLVFQHGRMLQEKYLVCALYGVGILVLLVVPFPPFVGDACPHRVEGFQMHL
jgi:hypothetical protein